MSNLAPPHGGKLLPLLVPGSELEEGIKEVKLLPKVRLSSREVSSLIMLAMGVFSPLQGFTDKEDSEVRDHLSSSVERRLLKLVLLHVQLKGSHFLVLFAFG